MVNVRSASDVVIWSADVEEQVLLDAANSGAAGLQFLKVDRVGLTTMGLGVIDRLQALGFEVFADAKIVEIADKSQTLAEIHLRHKPWMLNCMAGIVSTANMSHKTKLKLRDGLKRFADVCHVAGTRPCAVTVLTSKTAKVVAREFNGRTSSEQVLVYADWMLDAGFTDMVCSTEELPIIRSESRFDGLDLDVPGIRLPGSDVRDQARVGTPSGAIAAKATRLVIGSDLTNGDLSENFARIAHNLAPALNA